MQERAADNRPYTARHGKGVYFVTPITPPRAKRVTLPEENRPTNRISHFEFKKATLPEESRPQIKLRIKN